MNVPFADLTRMHTHALLERKFKKKFEEILWKGNFILGKEVEEFEKNFAKYCEVDYAAGVSNGTDALELILRSYDIGKGDEVIIPANTFIATATAVASVGARPVLVDIPHGTDYNIDVDKIMDNIHSKTKAIMPVHLYGKPCNIKEILDISRNLGIKVIEDACQAHGARYDGQRIGSFGDAAGFSFYPGKNLGAFGDAGIVVSNDKKLIERVKTFRNYGQSKKYFHDIIAFNKRLDTLQAAMLDVKLPHLDEWNEERKNIASRYNSRLSEFVKTPSCEKNKKHVYHQYVIKVHDIVANSERRDELQKYLAQNGIQTGIHYPRPIHLQKAFSYLGYKEGDFPVTEISSKRILSLPIFSGMKNEEIDYVINVLGEFHGK